MLYLGTFFESYSETFYKGQDHIDPRMSEELQGFVSYPFPFETLQTAELSLSNIGLN